MHLQKLLTKLFILLPIFLTAGECNDIVRQAYIDTFSPIAIREMHRSNIPASIILAQGIIESGSGQGVLAGEAKNHFGIKCKGDWKGDTFYHKDDDFDSKGKKVKSCFRKYKTVLDSYIDHTNFLLANRRYQDLFKIGRWDYKKWALGLQAKSYATNPNYAKMLIETIETHQLYIYDLAEDFGDVVTFYESNFQESTMAVEQKNEPSSSAYSSLLKTSEMIVSGRIARYWEPIMDSNSDTFVTPSIDVIEPSERMRPIYYQPTPSEFFSK